MGVNAEPEPLAVADPAGAARDGGAAAARVGQRDAGQVADGVRDGHRHLPDRDVGAGSPAGWPELRRDSRQVPAYRPAAARPAQHVPLVFEPAAGSGVAFPVPAQLTADHIAAYYAAPGWQAAEQRLPVITWDLAGVSHTTEYIRPTPSASARDRFESAAAIRTGRQNQHDAARPRLSGCLANCGVQKGHSVQLAR